VERGVGEITALLMELRDGGKDAGARLLPLVYAELEAIARAYVHRRPEVTLEPQELVHELYVRLQRGGVEARDRKHFYTIAALAMRQILTDRARRRRAAKRSGEIAAVTLSKLGAGAEPADAVAVERALERLEALSPRQARIVELRCLVGLSVPEVAQALELSERTVFSEWRLARAWLLRELGHTRDE
jgi:RNA polymerase sigma factor (TIGR02999 family)